MGTGTNHRILFILLALTVAPLAAAETASDPHPSPDLHPFSAPAAILSDAQALVGRGCGDVFSPDSKVFDGFEPVHDFATVIAKDAYVVVRAKSGVRIAFLLGESDGDLTTCRIADFAVLPAAKEANAFLQCHADPSGTAGDPPLSGFGMRLAGHKKLVAFWSIDHQADKLERVPVDAKAPKVTCQEPETGE